MAGDSNFDSVVLHLPFDGPNNGVDIRERSNSRKVITVVGGAKLSTAQAAPLTSNTTSLLLDGTGDYLTVPDSADWTFGSGSFTIEGWVRLDATWSAQGVVVTQRPDNTVDPSFFLGVTASRLLRFIAASSTSTVILDISGTTTLPTGTWHHVAAVRNGSTFTIYLNGVSEASTTSATALYDSTATLVIGGDTNSNQFKGHIDDLRITKGVSRYTSTFSVPTEPNPIGLTTATDMNYSKVSLLLNADGSTIVDESPTPKTITAVGQAALTKVYSKVGAGSLVFDGAGDYLTVPAHVDIAFGTGDFTIEFWANQKTRTASEYDSFFAFDASATPFNTAMALASGAGASGHSFLVANTAKTAWAVNIALGTLPSLNTWNHYAVVRSGTSFYIFINGIQVGTGTSAQSINTLVTGLYIGYSATADSYLDGYMDGIRLTKGVARYTTTFTPPNYVLSTLSTPAQGAIGLVGQTPGFSSSFLGTPTQRTIQIVGQTPSIPTAFAGTPTQRNINLVGQTPVFSKGFLGTPTQRTIQIVGRVPNMETLLSPVISENISVVTTLTYLEFISIIESILTDTSIFSGILFNESILESTILSDILRSALSLGVVEAIVLESSSASVVNKLEELVSVISLHSTVSSTSSFLEVLTATISLVSSLEKELDGSITESLIVSELLISLYSLYSRIIDTIVLDDTLTNSYVNILLLTDSIEVSESIGSRGTLSSLVNEEILLQIPEILGDDKYLAYLLSPETNSVSTYTNYNFNGCTPFKGKYLFYNRTGLYEYGGELDDTTKIRSELETVAFNFKSSNLKQVPSLYLGVNSTDNFILKVRVDGKAEVIYKLNKYTQNLQTQKIDIGKGLIGRYFQFELMTEASEFDLESIEFYPIELRRKL